MPYYMADTTTLHERRNQPALALLAAGAGAGIALVASQLWSRRRGASSSSSSSVPSSTRPQLLRMSTLPSVTVNKATKVDSVILHRARLSPQGRRRAVSSSADRLAELAASRDEWVRQLLVEVMPFWMEHSPDRSKGGFFTCLDAEGEVFDDTKYHWLQGRMVWTLAQLFLDVPAEDLAEASALVVAPCRERFVASSAMRTAWYDEARRGIDFLPAAELDDGTGRLWFSTTRDGKHPVHLQRKPYAAVFYAMGNLNAARMMKRERRESGSGATTRSDAEAEYLAKALLKFARLREWMADPSLLREGAAGTTRRESVASPHELTSPARDSEEASTAAAAAAPWTKLGDIMCVCCVALEFHAALDAEDDAQGQERAELRATMWQSLRQLGPHIHSCSLDEGSGGGGATDNSAVVFLENAPPGGRVAAASRFATPASRCFNPGHSIETSWFVGHVVDALRPWVDPLDDAALDELDSYRTLALETLRGALRIGWDTAGGGGILYMMDICGRPFLDATVVSDGKLWWPLCEALYACTYALEVTGDWAWLDDIKRVHEYISEHILDKERGGAWWGYLHRDGSVANEAKGGNFKGCFHVPRALLLSIQSADRILAAASQ